MATMPLPRARISIALRIENVRSVRGIIARFAAIRLLPIRSLYSRYNTTKAAAMATMPLPRNVVAVRIENVRFVGAISKDNANFIAMRHQPNRARFQRIRNTTLGKAQSCASRSGVRHYDHAVPCRLRQRGPLINIRGTRDRGDACSDRTAQSMRLIRPRWGTSPTRFKDFGRV